MVLPVFVVVVLFFALLISYPWAVLTIGTVCYLAALPLGHLSYRKYQRQSAEAAPAQAGVGGPAVAPTPAPAALDAVPAEPPRDPERPARLN
jgi:CDP-diacylglycerol--serine O-phosphatidyltransferase